MGNLGFQEILLVAVFVALLIVPAIFFLLTLQKTMETVEPQNRTLQPGKVWLLFIPLFNLVWIFILVKEIAISCQNQLEQYGVYNQQKPTYSIGLAWAVCTVCNWVPILGILSGLASLVLFVIYWVQINNVRLQMNTLKQAYSGKDENSIL